MNIDEKKEYLRKYRVLTSRVNRTREMMALCPENADRYGEDIERSVILRDKIEKDINSVDGGLLTEILSLKYMCGKSLEQISYCICYSRRQTERLHIKALQRLCIS